MENELVLGGNVFVVNPLSALRSFALQPRIAPPLAEVFGVLASLKTTVQSAGNALEMADKVGIENLLDADIDIESVIPVVGRFFSKLPADELMSLVRELLSGATMDNIPLFTANGDPFDVKMRGRTMDTWKLMWHAIKVNFPDFFGLLGASVGAKQEEAPSEQ